MINSAWDNLISLAPYALSHEEKAAIFAKYGNELVKHHYEHCQPYQNILDFFHLTEQTFEQAPPLHTSMFKLHELRSIQQKDVFKVTTSSGTTGQQVSKIYLDKTNIARQQKILSSIVKEWLGNKRLPMLIIDHPNVIKDRFSYSARGVGIQGLSLFGHHHTYALNEDMSINWPCVEGFIEQYKDEKIFIFGFTFMVWQYLLQLLDKNQKRFELSNALLLHSGGWKKLIDQAVSNEQFKTTAQQYLGAVNVHNFYGMVEQTGTIHVECEQGHLHCPTWSDVHVVSPDNLIPLPIKKSGIIELHSLLPTSYPGHKILTEDTGFLVGIDDCPCGRKGKYFQVTGRVKRAEIRGCSDTQS